MLPVCTVDGEIPRPISPRSPTPALLVGHSGIPKLPSQLRDIILCVLRLHRYLLSLACLKHQGGILVRCWATLAGTCQCWGVAALFRFKELSFLLYLTLSVKEPSTKLISAFGFCSLILSATAEMQSSLFPTTDLFNLLSHPTSLVKRPWNI